MSRRTYLKILLAITIPLGAYITWLLACEYVSALLGRQQDEWQIAFEVAPIPILLGLLSLAAALMAKPRFPGVIIALSLVFILLPALMCGLVSMRIF